MATTGRKYRRKNALAHAALGVSLIALCAGTMPIGALALPDENTTSSSETDTSDDALPSLAPLFEQEGDARSQDLLSNAVPSPLSEEEQSIPAPPLPWEGKNPAAKSVDARAIDSVDEEPTAENEVSDNDVEAKEDGDLAQSARHDGESVDAAEGEAASATISSEITAAEQESDDILPWQRRRPSAVEAFLKNKGADVDSHSEGISQSDEATVLVSQANSNDKAVFPSADIVSKIDSSTGAVEAIAPSLDIRAPSVSHVVQSVPVADSGASYEAVESAPKEERGVFSRLASLFSFGQAAKTEDAPSAVPIEPVTPTEPIASAESAVLAEPAVDMRTFTLREPSEPAPPEGDIVVTGGELSDNGDGKPMKVSVVAPEVERARVPSPMVINIPGPQAEEKNKPEAVADGGNVPTEKDSSNVGTAALRASVVQALEVPQEVRPPIQLASDNAEGAISAVPAGSVGPGAASFSIQMPPLAKLLAGPETVLRKDAASAAVAPKEDVAAESTLPAELPVSSHEDVVSSETKNVTRDKVISSPGIVTARAQPEIAQGLGELAPAAGGMPIETIPEPLKDTSEAALSDERDSAPALASAVEPVPPMRVETIVLTPTPESLAAIRQEEAETPKVGGNEVINTPSIGSQTVAEKETYGEAPPGDSFLVTRPSPESLKAVEQEEKAKTTGGELPPTPLEMVTHETGDVPVLAIPPSLRPPEPVAPEAVGKVVDAVKQEAAPKETIESASPAIPIDKADAEVPLIDPSKARPTPAAALSTQTKEILSLLPSHMNRPKHGDAAPAPIAVEHAKKTDLGDLAEANKDEVKSHESLGLKIEVKTPSRNVNVELERAYDALMAGQPETAVEIYQEVLSYQPDNSLALFGLATTYHRAGELGQARELYGRLLRIDPNNREAINNFLVLMADESPQEALQEMAALEQANPDFSPIPAQMAVVYERLGDGQAAVEKMGRALELSPVNLTYRYNLAIMLDKMGRWKEAKSLYGQLVEANLRGEHIPGDIHQIQERLTFITSNSP